MGGLDEPPVGPRNASATEMPAEPFQIQIEQAVLDDLQSRLLDARPRSHHDVGWSLGTNTTYLGELVAYWETHYKWRAHEASLNQFPQFRSNGLHFIHAMGRSSRAIPLLLLHGWPDSFYRFHKAIPLLINAGFDVVVPSLPGFAFSGSVELPVQQPNRHSAELLWKLMTETLGYRRFAVAGGDGGGVLAQLLAIDHPDSIIGVHLTDLGWHVSNVDPSTLSRAEHRYLEASKKTFAADGAYAMVQSTRPCSLAPALSDSPIGLASWIIDRFHAWSDCHGDVENSFSKDELLTNIMLYWVTNTIGSSMFSYFADRRSPSLTTIDRVRRPVAVTLFPRDIGGVPPRELAERTLEVTHWTVMPRGGHFAALEEPDLYARDVRDFFVRSLARKESRHDHPAL